MDLNHHKNGLQETEQLMNKYIATVSPSQQEIIQTRTEIRKK